MLTIFLLMSSPSRYFIALCSLVCYKLDRDIPYIIVG